MQTDHTRHFPTAAPAHYVPPLWATEGADRALKRHRSRQTAPRELTKACHIYSDANGAFVDGVRPCRGDRFCRGRCCKPPLSDVRAMRRLKTSLLIAATIVTVLLVAAL